MNRSKAPGRTRISRQAGIQSVEVGHRLLAALAATTKPMMLRDLAEQARMPAAKAHRYLVSFARIGLVEQDAATGHYDLGAFALTLGLTALGRLDAVTVTTPLLRPLADEIGQTVALAVWANHGATIVRWVGADAPVSASLRVGSVMPLTRSATGRVFVAFLHEARWSALLKRELAENARLDLAPTRIEALQSALSAIRSQGYAHTADFIPGISGLAAPVFGGDGSMALALVTLGYSASIEPERSTITRALLRCAAGASERLGLPPSAMSPSDS